eukprot:scaffold57_cov254-Pinguiococcus_pyrenoidosus.AAC.44
MAYLYKGAMYGSELSKSRRVARSSSACRSAEKCRIGISWKSTFGSDSSMRPWRIAAPLMNTPRTRQGLEGGALPAARRHEGHPLAVENPDLVSDVVEAPLAPLVGAGDLLLHRREHACRVAEAAEEEAGRRALLQPPGDLHVALEEGAEPRAQRREDPGKLVAGFVIHPVVRRLGIVQAIRTGVELERHDDLSVDRVAQLHEGVSHDRKDALESLRLLVQEHVQRLLQAAQLPDLRDIQILDEALGKLVQKRCRLLQHHGIPAAVAATAAAALRLRVRDAGQEPRGLRHHIVEVGVGVEPEDLRRVALWELADLVAVRVHVGEVQNVVCVPGLGLRREGEVLRQRRQAHPLLRVRVEEPAVERVRDLAAILHLAHDVLHGGDAEVLVVQVLLEEGHGRNEVSGVVLVGNAPPEGAELSPLLHARVHEAEHVQQRPPFLRLDLLEAVLIHDRDARRRLQSNLHAHLQQAQGELGVGKRREEEAEVLVHVLEAVHGLLHALHERQPELAVLHEHPGAVAGRLRDATHRRSLLTLTHTDDEGRRQLLLPCQGVHVLGRVGARAQQEDDRSEVVRAGEHVVELIRDGLHEPWTQRRDLGAVDVHDVGGLDELLDGEEAPILPQRAHEKQLVERPDRRGQLVELALVVGHRRDLRLVALDEGLPDGARAVDVGRQVLEELDLHAELVDVLPHFEIQPGEWQLRDGVLVNARPSAQQHHNVARREHPSRGEDLERDKQLEDELVLLVGTAIQVPERRVGEILADVLHAPDRGRLRAKLHAEREELVELLEAGLVHRVHQTHLRDDEVEHAAARGDRSELLALLVDLNPRLLRGLQLALDLVCLRLGRVEHPDELLVVKQVPGVVRESLQQGGVKLLQRLGVEVDLLQHALEQLFQGRFLVADHSSQELLFESVPCDREVNDRRLRLKLGGEAGIREAREEVHLELGVHVVLTIHHADLLVGALVEEVALQQRVQQGIQLVLDARDDEGEAALQAGLELLLELRVRQRRDAVLEAVEGADAVGLAAPDPGKSLALRDAVLDGQAVGWQAFHVPVRDRPRRDQEVDHVQRGAHGHALLPGEADELLADHVDTEVLVEGTAVRDEGRGHRTVTDKLVLRGRELARLGGPPHLLVAEGVNERGRLCALALHDVGLVLDRTLLRDLLLELGLELLHLLAHGRQAGLSLGQFLHLRGKRRLCHAERLELGLDDLRGHAVVLHRAHPDAETLGGLRGTLGDGRREVLQLEVRQQQLHRLVVDAVLTDLAEFDDLVQELGVPEHALPVGQEAGLDEVELLLLDVQRRALHGVQGLVEEDEHAVEHELDDVQRPLVGFDLDDRTRRDLVDGRRGRIDERLRQGKVGLTLGLLRANSRRFSLTPGRNVFDLALLLLGGGAFHLEDLEHLVRFGRGLLESDPLHGELLLHHLDVLGALRELPEAEEHPALLLRHLGHLAGVERLVELQEGQEGLRRQRQRAPKLELVLYADVRRDLVRASHLHHEVRLVVGRSLDLEVVQRPLAHGHQGLLRPRQEPVDGRRSEETGEAPSSHGELRVLRAHAKHDGEVVAHEVEEVLLQGTGRRCDAGEELLKLRLQVGGDGHHLILLEEVGDVASRQDGVDDLKEQLVLDVVVGEDEDALLLLVPGAVVHDLQIVLQGLQVVRLGEGDLEELLAAHVRGQAHDGALARAADAHEQGVGAWHDHDALHAIEVLERVVKEDQVHLLLRHALVQLLHEVQAGLTHGLQADAVLVDLGCLFQHDAFFFVDDVLAEARDHERWRLRHAIQGFLADDVSEAVLDGSAKHHLEGLLVRNLDQLVAEHPRALVLPQAKQELGR